MHLLLSLPVVVSLFSSSYHAVAAQENENDIPFSACPLIGTYYPPPTFPKSSDAFAQLASKLTKSFDDLIQNGGSEDYGPISPNTTSFSVALFAGSESLGDNPIIFEYHYISPEDRSLTKTDLTSSTKFPVGDVSMVFTVYAWLVQMGDQWETPITDYLPELANIEGPFTVPWEDVTIGSLAGHMSGLTRQSRACVIGEPCDWQSFLDDFAEKPPLFLPDTTPVVSYAAFQLLAFAMQQNNGHAREQSSWASLLDKTLFQPLNMTSSGVLSREMTDIFAVGGLNKSQIGEPGALSLVSSIDDLSRAGHSMLSSTLLSPGVTRRWLHPNTDTSNLRNGVGHPWEVYRSGPSAISPVVDALTKSGTVGQYASYFGLAPDFDTGFAILAHDGTVQDRKLDLNVHADIVSEALGHMQAIAANELALRYAGTYEGANESVAVLNITDNGPGLEVQKLVIGGVDVKARTAGKLRIKAEHLDFRMYPSNVQNGSKHQFVVVYQDRSAPVDKGTPTCITWQEVGAHAGVEVTITVLLDKDGNAAGLQLSQAQATLQRIA